MTFKEKYNSIDQTKLPETAKAYMVDFKKDSNNFTNKEAMAKMMPALDKFIAALKDSGYGEAIKGAAKKETKKKAETPTEMAKEIVEDAIEQPKTKTGKPKVGKISKGDFMKIAKEIRKEGESWNDAMKRAGEIIRKQKEGVKTKAVRQYEKLKKFIAKHPEVYKEDIPVRGGGYRKTTLEVDAPRIALPRGKRVSKKGWKNQYGKSDGGKTYYEYRSNRFDTNRKRYPFLADGGDIEKAFTVYIYYGGSRPDEVQYADTIEQARILAQMGEHSEIIDNSTNEMLEFAQGGNIPYIVWTSKDGNTRQLYKTYNSMKAAEIAAQKLFNSGDYENVGTKSKTSYEKNGFYAEGGETGKVIYLESVGTYFRPSDLMTSPSSAFDDMTFRIDEIENDEWFDSLSKKDYDIISKYYDISDRESGRRYAKGGNIGKVYYEQPNVGKAKYTVNFHDGVKTHKDGSPFYDMRIFKNKTDLNNFIAKLEKEGYEYKRYAEGGETDALYTKLLSEYETEGYPKMGISFKTFIESKKETAMGKGDYEMYRKLFDVLDAYEGDFYAKGGEVYTSTGMVKLKKGDKVRTREGNIETVSRINSNGNVETIENDYSHEPYTLTKISESGGELFGAGRFAKGGSISKSTTYVPNRDVKELMVVLKGELTKLKGKDILDGVYVKNKRKPSPSTESPKELLAFAKKKASSDPYGGEIVFDESDIQLLLDAGLSAQDVKNILIGYTAPSVKADTEFGKKTYGIINYSDDVQKEFIAEIANNAKKGYFEIGMKYPNDFNWKPIIEKYNISSTPKIVEVDFTNRKSKYEVYLGKGVAIGHQFGFKWNDNRKWSEEEKYGKLDSKNPEFKGGYWGIVTKSVEDMYFIVDTLLKQSAGYLKDLDMFRNGLGGVDTKGVEKLKFAKGGIYSSDDRWKVTFQNQDTAEFETIVVRANNKKNAIVIAEDESGLGSEWQYYSAEQEMAKGGKVGFKALSDKVAKYYSNKSVPSKYQSLYGKKYDKSEAKEVGDKVAAKVYRQQLAKKK